MKWGTAAVLCMAGTRVRAEGAAIRAVKVDIEGDTDIPRFLELLNVREGDLYSDRLVERGLMRLADTGKFIGLAAKFDEGLGRLTVYAELVPRVQAVVPRFQSGTNELLAQEVTAVVGLSPGDAIFPDQIPAIRERVLTRLHDRGYHQARVVIALEQREDETGLTVSISADLGERSQVSEIQLKGFSSKERAELESSLGLPLVSLTHNPREENRILPKNYPYDAVALDDLVLNWNLKAREKGYYDFQLRVDELERGVHSRLLMTLNRGPRYDLQFHGNVAFWERELRALVTDRPLRLGVPLSVPESENLLVRTYEKIGYADVRVAVEISDANDLRRVDFKIEEGPKYLLGAVNLQGISQAQSEIVEKAKKEWLKRFRNPFSRTVFDEKLLKSELKNLLSMIQRLGYLEARILEFRPQKHPQGSHVDVDIPFQLGERFLVRSVLVQENISLSDAELDRIITLNPGDPVDPMAVAKIRERLIDTYRQQGFLDAQIQESPLEALRRVQDTYEMDVVFTVRQGALIRVGTPVVEGLQRTHEEVVLRELGRNTLRPGMVWTPSGQDNLEQQLLNLSIFGTVGFEPVGGRILERASPTGDSLEIQEKDLKVMLSERPAGTIEFGPGFRTNRGFIGFAEMNYRNLGGWNRSAQLRTEVSRRVRDVRLIEQNYSFTYLEPYIFGRHLRLRFNTQYDRSDRYSRLKHGIASSGYSRETVSFAWGTEAQIAKNLRWIQNLYTLAFTHNFNVLGDASSAGSLATKFRVATMGTTLTYDNRNSVFNPTKGWQVTSAAEFSAPEIGSKALDRKNEDVGFARVRQDLTTYLRILEVSTLALSLSYTKLWSLGSIPPDNRPSLGGAASIRALKENALRFLGADIQDQESYEARVEYRQPVFYDFGVAYFLDMGQINAIAVANDGSRRTVTTGLRAGIGVGFRYKTVVGPISLDVAFNANPPVRDGRSLEDDYNIVFRIGAF